MVIHHGRTLVVSAWEGLHHNLAAVVVQNKRDMRFRVAWIRKRHPVD
jgi:hypothetical protein